MYKKKGETKNKDEFQNSYLRTKQTCFDQFFCIDKNNEDIKPCKIYETLCRLHFRNAVFSLSSTLRELFIFNEQKITQEGSCVARRSPLTSKLK